MSVKAGSTPVIADVARLAGVSVPTVSRVLTGSARVGEEKRLRVVAAIDELAYRPSPAARVLASGKARLISIVAGDTLKYGYAQTIRGVEEATRGAGYTVTITVVESVDDDTLQHAVSSVLSQPVAGVIVLNFDPQGLAVAQRLPPDLPVVLVSGARPGGVPHVALEEASAAADLTAYLLDLGHTTVHHVSVPHASHQDHRIVGWRRALQSRGADIPAVWPATWKPESGRQIGLQLASRPDVTAVFCGNDEIAMGLIRGVTESGRRVPDDLSVVGFDDHPLAAFWTPPLTTVKLDFGELGARAHALLLHLISPEQAAPSSTVRPLLMIRDTTGPPPRHGVVGGGVRSQPAGSPTVGVLTLE